MDDNGFHINKPLLIVCAILLVIIIVLAIVLKMVL